MKNEFSDLLSLEDKTQNESKSLNSFFIWQNGHIVLPLQSIQPIFSNDDDESNAATFGIFNAISLYKSNWFNISALDGSATIARLYIIIMSSWLVVEPTIAAVTRLPHVAYVTFSNGLYWKEPNTCNYIHNFEIKQERK